MKTPKILIAIAAMLVLSPLTVAQSGDQCDWWGRETIPICEKIKTGWSEENGKRCISRSTCVNDQPSDRGGVIKGKSGSNNNSGGSKAAPKKGPSGFSFSVYEGGKVDVKGTMDIAYGANGKFKYLRKQTRDVNCDNDRFGGDPIKGVRKACYVKTVTATTGDQCNTTNQCQATYGNKANDCANSQSNKSVCMCGSKRCDGKGGSNSNNSGGGGFDVRQPPSSCSNVGNRIPNGIHAHNIHEASIKRADFGSIRRWYRESGEVQRFQLHNGDQNQRTSILRPRLETFNPNRFKRNSGWHEFSANYYLSDWDVPQTYAIFQIKTNDQSNFIIQGVIDKDGSLEIRRRSKGGYTIADNVVRKPFNLRIRSNGRKFEVYYNCRLVLAENNPQRNLESNSTQYGWRWGLYRQASDDDRHDGTTTLFVTGAKFN